MLKKAFLLLTLVLSLISCKNKEAEPNEISQEERQRVDLAKAIRFDRKIRGPNARQSV